ncbi:MAG TPA: FAD:protein FMN transferase [Crocinitomix sp.]|nr:FAD:protein FMN transferase [Crocinitomix sp.]
MKKNIWLVLTIIFMIACNSSNQNKQTEQIKTQETSINPLQLYGNTQGTTYSIIVNDNIKITHDEIDQLLHQFDLALSSYIPQSILSQLNNAPAGTFTYRDSLNFFNRCLKQSQYIYELTNGAFDPTVYPLVKGWGFMEDIQNVPDSSTVDSLLKLIGFNDGHHFTFKPYQPDSTLENSFIIKNTPQAKLDFNAIAQGLSVDVICEELDKRNAKNYFVEIGGEIRVKGKNSEGHYWRIGIDKPIEKSNAQTREIQEIISLNNKAVATSGSYRKFYEKDGIKYSHTLNPKIGYPVKHSLLSATVVANNCALADGLATAFMVMGVEKTVKFIKSKKIDDIEVYLIFYNTKGRIETYQSKGFRTIILKDEHPQ